MKNLIFIFLLISLSSCGQTEHSSTQKTSKKVAPTQVPKTREGNEKAYFSSGCFWCSESIFQSVIGVKKVVSGYAGGKGKSPNYHNYAAKGHAETIAVTYDPKVIDFPTLLTVYFGSQNVTQQNGQGPDRGKGYRSIIFYQNLKEKKEIEAKIKEVQQHYDAPVAAEVKPFHKFWKAEEYHQDFEEQHPDNPYIRNISLPRLHQFKARYPELLKKNRD